MADLTAFSFDAYLGGIDITKNPPSFTNNTGLDPGGDFEFFGTDSALSTPTFITFPDSSPASPAQGWISESETASTQSRRASRRISGSIMEKVARFEALGGGVHTSSQRPCTPTNQMMNGTL
jgi:regulatory protein SWI5